MKRSGITLIAIILALMLAASVLWRSVSNIQSAPAPRVGPSNVAPDVPAKEIDWTLIGQVLGMMAASAVAFWNAYQAGKPDESLKHSQKLLADLQLLKDSLKGGEFSMSPSVDELAERIYLAHPDDQMAWSAYPGKEDYRYVAKSLLSKFLIVVRP